MAESHDPLMPSRLEDNEFSAVKATAPSGIDSGILSHVPSYHL